MEQGQARVAQSGLGVPLCPTGQQQQEDELSEWKETPSGGDRASAALTHRPARHIATILGHRGASRLAEPGSSLEKKGVSKTNTCICFSAPINPLKYLLLWLLVKVSAL